MIVEMKQDIVNGSDIQLLVNSFYDRVKKDEVIGHIFSTIIGDDWSHHLPIMYQFWTTILLHVQGYKGNAIQKHIDLDKKIPLQKEHFDRWLKLWEATVNELYEGAVANEAKNRASLMLNLISMKVEWSRLPGSIH
jgi:hemoglobin